MKTLISFIITALLLYTPAVYGAAPTSADITIVGDIMCLSGQLSAARVSGGWDFNPAFSQVSEIFHDSDYTIGNLETVIAGEDMGVTARDQIGMPVINAPYQFADALAAAGIDCLATANNHAMDLGVTGVEKTLQALDERGILHAGTALCQNPDPCIADVNGIKLGVLSYTQFINRSAPSIPHDKPYLVDRKPSDERLGADIARLRGAGAEFIIVFMHWGRENEATVTDYQQSAARAIANAGADAIIGSHPHILQKAQWISSSDGRRVPVLYSMGNFISSMSGPGNRDGIILNLHIVKNVVGRVSLAKASCIATTMGSVGDKSWCVLPCAMYAAQNASRAGALLESEARSERAIGKALSFVGQF